MSREIQGGKEFLSKSEFLEIGAGCPTHKERSGLSYFGGKIMPSRCQLPQGIVIRFPF